MNQASENANALWDQGARATTQTSAQFSYPDPATVKGRVLADLLAGRRITHLDCWREHGSSRLAHHAYVLRDIGWPVKTDELAVGTRDGRRATIGEYYLPADTILAAGERGQRFIASAQRRG